MNCPACDHLNVDGARYCAKCGALMPIAHAADDDPMIGSIVGGRYRITGLLGEGGMGRVYTGEQQMGTAVRKVAVKTLLQEFSKDPQVVARFMRECGTVVELEHPNTIKFYDFGQTDAGDLYIAMEHVAGQELAELIEREGALSFDRVLNIMKQICGSLHEAHGKGIVHRDLKPENVILTERAGEKDFVKVLDFGIAKRHDAVDAKQEQKLTQAGMVLGTPPYMSPEQFTGKELDLRSDIYALGVMAYEMLTGQLPFKANTPWEWATQHMTAQPSPFEGTGPMAAQIPPHMKQACMRALSKNAEERQDTAKAFYQELQGGDGRASVPLVSATAPGAAAGATEAFAAAVVSGGAGPARAGATQIGEPFVPPMDAGGPAPGAGMPMGATPHQNVPTAGGQAVPAPPMQAAGRGGGNKGMLIAAAGLIAAAMVVGIVVAFSGGEETESDGPLIPTGKQASTGSDADTDTDTDTDTGTGGASGDTATDTGTTATATTTTPTTTGTTTTTTTTKTGGANGTAACDEAISAAMGKNCSAAKSALSRCSGPKQGTAAANVNKYCSGSRPGGFRRPGR